MSSHSVSHDLGKDKAKEVAEAAFSSYKEKYSNYSPTRTWTSEYAADISFTVKGKTLDGNMKIHEDRIEMDLDVPFIFRPFKGKALSIIENEIKAWVAKAKDGQL